MPVAEHPQQNLFMDLLVADSRRDHVRFAEIQQTLLGRGWEVRKVDPPQPAKEPQVVPPISHGAETPAQVMIRMLSMDKSIKGPGAC